MLWHDLSYSASPSPLPQLTVTTALLRLATLLMRNTGIRFEITALYVKQHDCYRLQLCDKQQPTAVSAATQFGPPVTGKVCSCTLPSVVTSTGGGDRSASPSTPVSSNPGSPASIASTPEDLRDTSRSARAAICESSTDTESKSTKDT